MPRKTDSRTSAIDAAEKLFRMQGYAATGLTQILAESGSPKGSFYFHFPRGKTQLAEETIDRYVAGRAMSIRQISENTKGDALAFVKQLCSAAAADMAASDFQYGCLMQNLANELAGMDAALTERIAHGFVESTNIAVEHFRGCGFSPKRAASTATALTAGLEGARTIARLERTTAVFKALADVSAKGLGSSGG
jgi:TetR/AcrR family transcriptional regulator, lmrAB and yxaGH operons repressor